MTQQERVRRVRLWLAVLVVGLVASGVTAFPLEIETRYLMRVLHPVAGHVPGIANWIGRIHEGVADTGRRYPFIAYGTDWLA